MSLELEKQAINKKRVKMHRERRKMLGLKEMKFWVREADAVKVLKAIKPFLMVADNLIYKGLGKKYPKYKLSPEDGAVIEK